MHNMISCAQPNLSKELHNHRRKLWTICDHTYTKRKYLCACYDHGGGFYLFMLLASQNKHENCVQVIVAHTSKCSENVMEWDTGNKNFRCKTNHYSTLQSSHFPYFQAKFWLCPFYPSFEWGMASPPLTTFKVFFSTAGNYETFKGPTLPVIYLWSENMTILII